MKHFHHIIPKHLGGTDDSSNLIELTVEEHAEAHRILYETYGRWQDRLAWVGLAGLAPKAELVREAISLANTGRISPNKGKKASPELREKMRIAKLGKKYGSRKPYKRTEKSMCRKNRGKPWSEARRAAQTQRGLI
jgi:hypothetical protein